MRNLLLCFVFLHVLVSEANAQVCDSVAVCENRCCCGSEVALPAGLLLSHVHRKGEWMFSYRFMNMNMDGIHSGFSAISKNDVYNQYLMAPKSMQSNMHMLMAMYGVSNRFTLMLMGSYNTNTMEMSMFPSDGMNMPGMTVSSDDPSGTTVSSGLGDIKIHALYNLLSSSNHQLIASAGINIPTGTIYYSGATGDLFYPATRLPYSMQLGSGTFDFLPALSYSYKKENLTTGIQLSGAYRAYNNALSYRLGNEAGANVWLAYRWLKFFSSSLRIETMVNDKIQGHDAVLYNYYEPSANPINYGGQRISAYLGSTLQIRSGVLKNNKIGAEYGLPLYQYVNGIQSPAKSMINVYWSLSF